LPPASAFLAFFLLCNAALAAPLRVALGESKLPYVAAETQSGIEYDLVSAALKRAGIVHQIYFIPNKRAQAMLANGELDAAINNDGTNVSEPYIAYKNMAITLCEKRVNLEKISDLARYPVGAFQNAHLYLGAEFAAVAQNKTHYFEVAQQHLLTRMLSVGRIDVVVSDINVFKQFNREVDPTAKRDICPFPLFSPTRYRLAFRDAAIRDRFNAALSQLREAGMYEELAKKYDLPLDGQRPYFKP
jgi:polar amino acid transport system substrate-binding protein